MKSSILFSFLGAMSMASMAALAQVPDVETVTVTPQPKTDSVKLRYPMNATEFQKFIRVYELSNGMSISLYQSGPLRFARLNDQVPDRIVATSNHSFESTRSKLRIKIDFDDADNASGEAIIPISSTMVSNSASPETNMVKLH